MIPSQRLQASSLTKECETFFFDSFAFVHCDRPSVISRSGSHSMSHNLRRSTRDRRSINNETAATHPARSASRATDIDLEPALSHQDLEFCQSTPLIEKSRVAINGSERMSGELCPCFLCIIENCLKMRPNAIILLSIFDTLIKRGISFSNTRLSLKRTLSRRTTLAPLKGGRQAAPTTPLEKIHALPPIAKEATVLVIHPPSRHMDLNPANLSRHWSTGLHHHLHVFLPISPIAKPGISH